MHQNKNQIREEHDTLEKNKKQKMLRSLHQHSTHCPILPLLRLSSLLFLFSLLTNHGHLVKAHIFMYAGCSREKYQLNSPFETNLNSLLSSVISYSSQALYNSFAPGNDSSTSPQSAVFGLYQCRGDLKAIDCSRCISSAVSQIGLVCPYTYGASLQLDGCFVRFEHTDFLGKLDTSLRYRKCSRSVSNDVEFFRRRDDVLADLQGAIGFRVSSSGLIEGVAQCLGDLSAVDCSSCLSEALVKLKSLCGSAEASDVFLAHCYARYWASGYYDASSGQDPNLTSHEIYVHLCSRQDTFDPNVIVALANVASGLRLSNEDYLQGHQQQPSPKDKV
ncbi:unnamed protein product [Ilex paraguariensis]|uniref:Gnk2-homologous domain-containing protein n=1 Tax=Ilex paraguariensis TaxID=185542 RepID=A0ABC8SB97_9AQUA